MVNCCVFRSVSVLPSTHILPHTPYSLSFLSVCVGLSVCLSVYIHTHSLLFLSPPSSLLVALHLPGPWHQVDPVRAGDCVYSGLSSGVMWDALPVLLRPLFSQTKASVSAGRPILCDCQLPSHMNMKVGFLTQLDDILTNVLFLWVLNSNYIFTFLFYTHSCKQL